MEKDDKILRGIIKAIRAKCLDCCGVTKKEVHLCVLPHCPLYRYRLGEQPEHNKHPMTRAAGVS